MPAYEKIKTDILDRIDRGALRPGDRIPSEHQLVERFGVSRMTVNRALRELSDAGRLLRISGTGTFVAQPNTDSGLLEIRSVDDHIAARGGVHLSRVIRLERVAADEETAAHLDLHSGDAAFHAIVLHFDRNTPFQLEDRYVNAKVAPAFGDQDFSRMTPSRYLVREVPVTEIEHAIEAVSPDAVEARRLGISGDEPCLVLRRRTWWNDAVVTRVRLISPGRLFGLSGRFKPFSPR